MNTLYSAYQLNLHSSLGVHLTNLSWESFELSRREMEVGSAKVTIPASAFPFNYFERDQILTIERDTGRGLYLEGNTLWFLRGRAVSYNDSGLKVVTLTFEDSNTVLKRRIIAYYEDETQTLKVEEAGRMLTQLVNENLGSGAVAGRNISTYLTSNVLAAGPGPTLEKDDLAWQPLLNKLKEVCEASEQAGVYLTFDTICTELPSSSGYQIEFRPYYYQLGRDLSESVRVGPSYGNVKNFVLEELWADEGTHIYAGGEGSGDTRLIVELSDTTKIQSSPLGRFEQWIDASSIDDPDELTTEAEFYLKHLVKQTSLSGSLVESELFRWGSDIYYGDSVRIDAEGIDVVSRLKAYALSVDSNGLTNLDVAIVSD